MAIENQRSKKVILVDDDKVEEMILRQYLKKIEHSLALSVFNSGKDFIEYMECARNGDVPIPDVVLLDLRMREMDGFEVLKIIRQMPGFAQSPRICIFSTSKEEKDIRTSRLLGADAYWTKPRSKTEYLALLDQLTKTGPHQNSGIH